MWIGRGAKLDQQRDPVEDIRDRDGAVHAARHDKRYDQYNPDSHTNGDGDVGVEHDQQHADGVHHGYGRHWNHFDDPDLHLDDADGHEDRNGHHNDFDQYDGADDGEDRDAHDNHDDDHHDADHDHCDDHHDGHHNVDQHDQPPWGGRCRRGRCGEQIEASGRVERAAWLGLGADRRRRGRPRDLGRCRDPQAAQSGLAPGASRTHHSSRPHRATRSHRARRPHGPRRTPFTVKFVAVAFDTAADAEAALPTVRALEHEHHLSVRDAAVVICTASGRIELQQTKEVAAGEAIVGGGTAGLVAGLLLGVPVGGALLGLAGGTLFGLRDTGIPDDRLRELGRDLQPGHAVLCVLVDPAGIDRTRAALSRYGAVFEAEVSSADSRSP
jgi:uncharacterized membrane protein